MSSTQGGQWCSLHCCHNSAPRKGVGLQRVQLPPGTALPGNNRSGSGSNEAFGAFGLAISPRSSSRTSATKFSAEHSLLFWRCRSLPCEFRGHRHKPLPHLAFPRTNTCGVSGNSAILRAGWFRVTDDCGNDSASLPTFSGACCA